MINQYVQYVVRETAYPATPEGWQSALAEAERLSRIDGAPVDVMAVREDGTREPQALAWLDEDR